MQKKSSYVDFPVNDLDLSQYITGTPPRSPYSLYGISVSVSLSVDIEI